MTRSVTLASRSCAALALALALSLGGCVQGPGHAGEASSGTDTPPRAGIALVIEQTAKPGAAIVVGDVLDGSSRHANFTLVDAGDDEPRTMSVHRESRPYNTMPVPRGWLVRRVISGPGASAGPQGAVLSLENTPAGLALRGQLEYADDVVTNFEPPMIVLPPVLLPGEPSTSRFEMIVHPATNLELVKTRGPASHEVVYRADEVVRVPAGRFRTVKIVGTLRAELGSARVTDVTESWYALGAGEPGLVAERTDQRVTVLGFPVRSVRQTWVLSEFAKP